MSRFTLLSLSALALAAAPAVASAQDVIVRSGGSGGARAPRAVLGVGTSSNNSLRDTLGILVSSVASNSPAEKAGIEEGSRLQAINGVNLRATKDDVEDGLAGDLPYRRLTRELGKRKPGDEVELRVHAGGQTRTVRVRLADSDSLYASRSAEVFARVDGERIRRSADEMRKRAEEVRARADSFRTVAESRPVLGLSVGSTGSRRDTLGVMVMRIVEGGPAEKAGIEEGARIQSIDGVDLRVPREDVEDGAVAAARARRLTRTLQAKKAGDDVELRVYQGGQTRTVRVKTVRAADLPNRGGTTFFFGDGNALMPSVAPRVHVVPMAPRGPRVPLAPAPRVYHFDRRADADLDLHFDDEFHFEIDGERLGDELARLAPRLRRQLEEIGPRVRVDVERAMRDLGPAIDRGLEGAAIGLEAGLVGLSHAIEGIDFRVDVDAERPRERRALRPAELPAGSRVIRF